MKITKAMFKAATGRAPKGDDLKRCNCTQAGEEGHFFCGWNHADNVPMFQRLTPERKAGHVVFEDFRF